ncbi:MAG: hypothetical protein AMXMBFR59_40780 [Rhodanobacteraceae bacterium]
MEKQTAVPHDEGSLFASSNLVPEFDAGKSLPDLPAVMSRHPAVVIRGAIPRSIAEAAVEKLMTLRPQWGAGPVPDEYNYGTVFYAHAMNKNIPDYFARSGAENERMGRDFPELFPAVMRLVQDIMRDEEVTYRPGWSGPSFVYLGPGSISAVEGGTIHIDWEGFSAWDHPKTEDLLSSRELEAYTLVLMLQNTPEGGGVRIWDKRFDPGHRDEFIPDPETAPDVPFATPQYAIGDLVVLHSMTVHQIQPYAGGARITLNFHLVRRGTVWHLFF